MKCHRCGGAMINTKFYNPDECFWGLKCLICGDIIDPLILTNRMSVNPEPEKCQPRRRRKTARSTSAGNKTNASMNIA